jgi:RsiW-degrading membrane proteinase PrsW (M82 family)
MADVSPGGVPDQGATPPAPEAPTSAHPAPSGPPAQVFPDARALPEDRRLPEAQSIAGPSAPYPGAAGYPPAPYATAFRPAPSEAVATRPDAWRDPATGRARSGWRRWLPIAVVIALIAAGAIGMLLFLGVNFGGVALLVGIIAAVIPVPLLVAAFFWLDRYEPEPIHLLAFCFAWGATVATSVALLVNTGAAALFDKLGLSDSLVAVLIAPLIEESMKASAPLLLFWRRREEWSGITDGIVYCGLSALGFAMVENVLYLGGHGYAAGVEQYGEATGLQNVFAIFIVRILFTGFAHPLFTSMTGIGLGLSSRSGDRRVRWLAPIAGLLLAMMLHGTFNLLPTLSVKLSQPFIMLYGYLGFMVPFFFAVVGFAIALRGWEGRIAERILPFYVRTGWFAPPEVAALGSLGRRHSARQWAKRVAGPAGQRAMKGFQFAATQLALLRDGMQRGLHRTPVSLARAEAEEQRLLAAIVNYRSSFAGRDPQMPQAFWNGEIYQIAFPDGVTRSVSPPEEPVVPVPIRFAQSAYAGYGVTPGYGTPPGYGPQPYGAPGYGASGYGASGYGASGYGASGYGAPGYGAPSYGAPGYGAPGYGAAGYGASSSGVPGSGIPDNAAPGHAAPGYSAPGYGTPGYGTPDYVAPTYGASASGTSTTEASPGYATSGHATAGYGAPASGTPASGTPAHEASPGYAAPGYGMPAYGAPTYAPPTSGTAAYRTPGYAAPTSATPGYAAPTYGTPGSGVPGYGASAPGQPGQGSAGYGGPAYGTMGQAGPSASGRPEAGSEAEGAGEEQRPSTPGEPTAYLSGPPAGAPRDEPEAGESGRGQR